MQCTGTITLACLIFELLPFFCFSYLNFVRSISPKLLARVMKFHGLIDLIEGECIVKES